MDHALVHAFMQDMFSNREIAIAIWLVALGAFVSRDDQVRRSVYALARAVFRVRLVVVYVLLAAFVVTVVRLLQRFDLWSTDMTKDTVMWFFFSGISSTLRGVVDREGAPPLWKDIFLDQLKIAVLIEYLVGTYTFSLPIELVLQPAIALVGMLVAVSERKRDTQSAAKVFRALLVLVGLGVVASAGYLAWADRASFDGRVALRSLALAPLLALAVLPIAYLMALIAAYECLFTKLRIGSEKPAPVTRYARLQFLWHLKLRRKRVLEFMRVHASDIINIWTKADVDALLASDASAEEAT